MKFSSVPYYIAGFAGEIIQSWKFRSSDPKQLKTYGANYVPRCSEHGFAPKDGTSSTRYTNLDLFYVHQATDNTAEYVTMKFQREAKVYLFVMAWDVAYPDLKFDGS